MNTRYRITAYTPVNGSTPRHIDAMFQNKEDMNWEWNLLGDIQGQFGGKISSGQYCISLGTLME